MKTTGPKELYFDIITNKNTFTFKAQDVETKKEWVNLISKTIETLIPKISFMLESMYYMFILTTKINI